jgi:succinoglycan biosynthesis transport protein ExoP
MGIGVGRLRDLLDRVFRTSAQIEEILQAPCISIVPVLDQSRVSAASPAKKPDLQIVGERIICRRDGLFWQVVDAPFSRSAEAVRAIKVAIDLNKGRKSNKVIGITSALPNEGKSTIAAALAQVMAQGGARVLLIDADLRNPSLTRRLTPEASTGLFELIEGRASIDDLTWTEPNTSMRFLPAVMRARVAHTHEILSSDETTAAIDRLRAAFDYVVLDLSPLAPVVDVRALTHLVDSFVFVVEWGRTKIETVEHALADARGVYDNLAGVVLNKANIGVLSRYESHHGNYYYNKYYSRYGYTD